MCKVKKKAFSVGTSLGTMSSAAPLAAVVATAVVGPTTESVRERVEKHLANLVASGQSAEVVELARKRYGHYLITPAPVSATTEILSTTTEYSTSTSTTATPMYSVSTEKISEVVNSTVASVTEALAEASTSATNYVYSTTTGRPTRLYKAYTKGLAKLSSNLSSTVPFSTSTASTTTVTTPSPTPVATTVAQWVNTTTEGGLVISDNVTSESGYTEICRPLQRLLESLAGSVPAKEISGTTLPTSEEGVTVMGGNHTEAASGLWGGLSLEEGPLYYTILLLGVVCLGKRKFY